MDRLPIMVQVAGGFSVRDCDGKDLTPKGQKSKGILAYLAIKRGEQVQRSVLVDLFWSDRGAAQGRGSLRQAVYDIREQMGAVSEEILVADRRSIQLGPTGVDLDVWDRNGTINESLTKPLLDGLDPIAPVFDDWLEETRRYVVRRQLRRAERRLAELDPASDPEAVLKATEAVLVLDPVHEGAARAAMSAYGAQERISGVIQTFERLQNELHADGFEVSAKTHDHLRTLQHSTTAPAETQKAPPPGYSSRQSDEGPPIIVMRNGKPPPDPASAMVYEEYIDLLVARLTSAPEIRVAMEDRLEQNQPNSFFFEVAAATRGSDLVLRLRLNDSAGMSRWTGRFQLATTATEAEVSASADGTIADMLPQLEAHIAPLLSSPLKSAYGHYVTAKRIFQTPEARDYMEKVNEHLEAAIRIDPNFVPAYDLLVQSYNTGHFMTCPGLDVTELRERALQLAQRLLSLNSRFPNAHIAMAWCEIWRSNFIAAERNINTAISLKPHEPHRLNAIATMLTYLGDFDGAMTYYDLARTRMAHDLDYQRSDYGELFYLRQEFDIALSWLQITERRATYRSLFWRAATHAQLGNLSEARADLDALASDIGERWAGPGPYSAEAGIKWYISMKRFRRRIDTDIMLDGLTKAGLRL